MQAIGIVLVVLGHSFHEYPDGHHGTTLLVYRMIYSFHMPLFLFVSGFLMVYTTGAGRHGAPSLLTFARGKAMRLLLPYVVLSLVTFVPRSLLSSVADDAVPLSAESLAHAMLWSDALVIPYFWFLQTSFTLLVGTYVIVRLCARTGIPDAVSYPALFLGMVILPETPLDIPRFFALYETCLMGSFFMAGAVYCRFMGVVDRIIRWSHPAVLSGWTLLWVLLFIEGEGTPLRVPCALAGICMMISLTRILERRGVGILDSLVGANYLIFLLSWYLNVLCQQVLGHFVALPWYVHTLLSLAAGIFVPWLGYRYMLRHPAGRWVRISALLLGQSLKPNTSRPG